MLSQFGWVLRRMDWLLVLVVLALLVIGVAFIYSASYRGEDTAPAVFYQRQIIWAIIGLVVMMGAAAMDYRALRGLAWWLYAAAMVLLILVLVAGQKRYGATRWLNVFGFQLQPSEFAKLAVLVVLARFLSRPGRDPASMVVLFQVLVITSVPFVLIAKEPDLGTAAMLVPLAVFMMFVAGVPLQYLALLGAAGVPVAVVGWFFLSTYQKERILVFLDPNRDPLGAGWNKIQSAIAVGSGGLTGKGFLKGTQNVLGFLPRTVAPTDFIYSVIAEEAGFVGSAILIALYLLMLGLCVRAALVARDRFGRMLSTGAAALLFAHGFVNMAMTVGLLPITGLPLPFISYGGSFMLATMIMMGWVQSVYIRRIQE